MRALVSTDTEVIVNATVGRVKKTCKIPIRVTDYASTLNDNSWEMIAEAAASGIAGQLWNVGDSKYFELGGTQIETKIIAFNADPLDTADEKYSDTSYNGNKKKAAIVFQFFTSPGIARMHNYNSEVGWDTCQMRTTTIADLYNSLPSDLKSVIRLVKKYSYNGYNSRNIETADRLFLESAYEVLQSPGLGSNGNEASKRIFYTYYANGQAPIKSVVNWTRSMHGSGCSIANHFAAIGMSGSINYPGYNARQDYFPMFCI